MKSKWLVPVVAASVLLTAVGPISAATLKAGKIKTVEFVSMDTPKTTEEKTQLMYSQASMQLTYQDGSTATIPLSYETLFRTGDVKSGHTAGVTTYADGKTILRSNGSPYISDSPDMNSLFRLPGMPEHTFYLVSQFESMPKNENGSDNPGTMALSTVQQDPETSKLTVTDVRPIDFSAVHGLWKPCAGNLSPWNTHLGSEETEPDARAHELAPDKSAVTKMMRTYYQNPSLIGNPYYYGHVPEVTVAADGSTQVVKHYSMGRMAFEAVKVLPDRRTILYGIDTNPGGLFIYVADQAEDLSAGTLYAAKWVQTGTENGGSADLQWIKLGHGTDAEINALADTAKFSQIFDATDDPVKGQAEGYKRVRTAGNGKTDEWLKLKPGMEKAAAFLETHRYAAYLGATVEFNKMEDVDYNVKENKGYVVISYLQKTMLEDATGPADDIRLPQINAGGIFTLDFQPNRKTRDGKKIDSRYVPATMTGYLMGKDLAVADADGNRAHVDRIANPDNVAYSETLRTLFIAEDSDLHSNNYAWAYNIDTRKLARIASVPAGGEATGLQTVENPDGTSYLMLSSQRPGNVGYLRLPSLIKNKPAQ